MLVHNGLDIKFGAVLRFRLIIAGRGVMVRRLKLMTTVNIYNRFASANMAEFLKGLMHTGAGDGMLCSCDNGSQKIRVTSLSCAKETV